MAFNGRLHRTTRQEQAETAPERWAAQYGDRDKYDVDRAYKSHLLNALPLSERTPTRINAIIGNESWTRLTCSICEAEVDAVTIVRPRYSYHSYEICDACWTSWAVGVREANRTSKKCK